MLLTLVLFTLFGILGTRGEETTCTKFEYDQKMLQKMVALEWELKMMAKQLAEQQERLDAEFGQRQLLESQWQKLERVCSLDSTGSSYIRWGSTSCPGNGTELIYRGFAAGGYFASQGAAANYICLPEEPLWDVYEDAVQTSQAVVGAEYRLGVGGRNYYRFFGANVEEQDVPCSVCHTTRATIVMIPGRNKCYDGWTEEYHGYLSAGVHGHHASEFVCLDRKPETLYGGSENQGGKLFYFTEARCGPLKCPPYVNGRELTCVVCSK